ncbi:MAG TPA: hypothetical protein VH482_02940 [Thermomicrobiales bacterium]|jgi:hypothetical protein
MRRMSIVVPIIALVLAGWFATGRVPLGAVAQEGTPSAGESGLPEGFAFEALAYGPVTTLPSLPAAAVMARLTLQPGARIPDDEPDAPTSVFTLFYVESGTLTLVGDKPFTVTRGTKLGAEMANPNGDITKSQEAVPAATEVKLGAGDSTIVPGDVKGEARNDGAAPVVMLLVEIEPTGA